ncbi:MAG: hypothetical protein ACRC76_10050 [Proteocatella sp.]
MKNKIEIYKVHEGMTFLAAYFLFCHNNKVGEGTLFFSFERGYEVELPVGTVESEGLEILESAIEAYKEWEERLELP